MLMIMDVVVFVPLGNAPLMKELRMLIMKPIMPMTMIPSVQTFMVIHTSLLSGFLASRISLEQDFRKEPSPKSNNSSSFYTKGETTSI